MMKHFLLMLLLTTAACSNVQSEQESKYEKKLYTAVDSIVIKAFVKSLHNAYYYSQESKKYCKVRFDDINLEKNKVIDHKEDRISELPIKADRFYKDSVEYILFLDKPFYRFSDTAMDVLYDSNSTERIYQGYFNSLFYSVKDSFFGRQTCGGCSILLDINPTIQSRGIHLNQLIDSAHLLSCYADFSNIPSQKK